MASQKKSPFARQGQSWSFPPEFEYNDTPHVKMTSGTDVLKQSLQQIFMTEPGERIMRENYGAGMSDFIYENISEDLLAKMELRIRETILLQEPRIRIDEVAIRPSLQQSSRLLIQIIFGVQGSEKSSSVEGILNLHDGRALRLI